MAQRPPHSATHELPNWLPPDPGKVIDSPRKAFPCRVHVAALPKRQVPNSPTSYELEDFGTCLFSEKKRKGIVQRRTAKARCVQDFYGIFFGGIKFQYVNYLYKISILNFKIVSHYVLHGKTWATVSLNRESGHSHTSAITHGAE